MEINVVGQGEKSYKPDQVTIDVTISAVYKDHEEALIKGEESVLEFLKAMKPFGFEFEDFKTVDYQIKDELSHQNNTYKKIGVRYTRSLNLKFDYDIKKMAKMVETASKLKNAPRITARYGLKDTKSAEIALYADAYQNAKNQADIIANTAGLKVVRCAKINTDEEFNDYHSITSCGPDVMCKKAYSSASETMAQTYVPQDIVVNQRIYCVFVAE